MLGLIFLPATDPLTGEAEAAWLAVFKALELKIPHLVLEGDSSTVIESLQSSSSSLVLAPRRIESLVNKLVSLLKHFSLFSSFNIPRAANVVAQSLAAWAAAHSFSV